MQKTEFIQWATQLAINYKPAADVLEKLKHVRVIAFVGPTGVGKTTLIHASGLPYVLSDVTRDKREGEKDDHDYHFKNNYEEILADIKQGQYVQFVINTNHEFYGTRANQYPDGGVCAMAIIAKAIPQFRTLGFADILPIYILPPSYVEWMHRIGSARSSDLEARFTEARESLPIALADPTYHFVLNDNIEDAVDDIKLIAEGKPIAEHRDFLARQTAELLIGRLGEV